MRQADYYRYIAEFRSGDEKSKAAEEARKAYADAAKVAKDDLAVSPWLGFELLRLHVRSAQ